LDKPGKAQPDAKVRKNHKDRERLIMKTVSDVAKEYQVSAQSVYRWIKAKKLRAIKLPGGTYRIDDQEIEKIRRGVSGQS